jgi:hypothetical protein
MIMVVVGQADMWPNRCQDTKMHMSEDCIAGLLDDDLCLRAG